MWHVLGIHTYGNIRGSLYFPWEEAREASVRAVTYSAFAYQIQPGGCQSSQENALRQGDALTEVPVALQLTRPLYSCVWSVHFFLRARVLRTDFCTHKTQKTLRTNTAQNHMTLIPRQHATTRTTPKTARNYSAENLLHTRAVLLRFTQLRGFSPHGGISISPHQGKRGKIDRWKD